MTSEIWTLLGVNLVLMIVVMSLVAVPSFRTKDPSYVDAFWGIGFVILAGSSFVQSALHAYGNGARRGALLALTALWGFRLGGYLLWRWRRNGPDARYQAMLKTRRSGSEAVFIWRKVFLVQGLILAVVALPVQLGVLYDGGLTWWNGVGIGLALFGIAFESTADFQLAVFKADAAHRGQVMDRGLWRYSRHPNYFGESCTWWGLGLLAVSNPVTALALLGPVVITFFLLKVSGVGLLEAGLTHTKPQYAGYIASTSPFLPLPVRKGRPAAS